MPTLKKFLHYYKPHKAMLIFDLICATIVSLVDISFPQILNVLNKSLFTMDATVILHTIGFVAIGLIVMYLIKLFCDYFIATWGHIMGSRMESAMRSDLFDKMQRLPFSYYDKNNTGEMMTKMVSDLFDISEVAHHGPENLFLAFLKLIGSFVLLMMVHVPLTLILFAVVIIMCIFSVFQNKRMKKAFSDNNKKIANINAQLQDSLAGIRVVKSFANETVEKEKFQKANVSFLSSKKHSYHAYGRFQSGNLYFQGILFTVILVFGGIFIAQGTLNAPDLALYALYINIFINPITILDDARKGPILVHKNFSVSQSVPFDTEDANVFLNGVASTLSAVRSAQQQAGFAVLYYNVKSKTIWAYTTMGWDNDDNSGNNSYILLKGEIKNIYYKSTDVMTPTSVRIEVDQANSDDSFDTSEDVDSDGYLTISLDSSELQYMFSIYGDLEVGDDVVLVCNRNGSSYTAVDALDY